MQSPRPWPYASYSTWNEWLVEYTFDKSRNPDPVDYIPASLEELCAIVGESPEQATHVLKAFSIAIVQELGLRYVEWAGLRTRGRAHG